MDSPLGQRGVRGDFIKIPDSIGVENSFLSKMTTVSIVIPTYNNAQFLPECLGSVFAQTFVDYEIVIIDDGSTDGTKEVLEAFRGKIRYYYQPNQGLAVARNRGLEESRGKFVTYLDADDVWLPENLKMKLGVFQKHPEIGGVFSDFSVFDESGVIHLRGTKFVFPFFKRTGKDFPQIFPHEEKIADGFAHRVKLYFGHVFSELFWGNFILPSSMVFRRDCALETGYFVSHMRTQQDYEYWLRFSKSYPLAYIDEVLMRYRRHLNQLTNHANIARIFETVIEIINQYESKFGGPDGRQQFNRRKSELLLDLSKVYMDQGRKGEARRLLLTSQQLYPRRISTYIQMALTFLPLRVISFMRAIKRRGFAHQSYRET